jgi:mRNA interferase MazF
MSADVFNQGPAGLVVVLPVTRTERGIPFHVEITRGEGGLSARSFILCDQIRSLARDRLSRRLGRVSEGTLSKVEERIRILLEL